MFGKKKIKVGKPTNVQRSGSSGFASSVAGNGALDAQTKGFLLAALAGVGNSSHGKVYVPEFNNWERGSAEVCIADNETGLNCWTAVIFWAFQGGAISKEEITRYHQELKSCITEDAADTSNAQNPIMYSMMRANQVNDIGEDDHPPAGVTVFFGDTTWQRPLNHVVASLGGGYCVSCASLSIGVKYTIFQQIAALNPSISESDLSGKRLVHVSKIKLIANAGDDKPRIRATARPFWMLPRIRWV